MNAQQNLTRVRGEMVVSELDGSILLSIKGLSTVADWTMDKVRGLCGELRMQPHFQVLNGEWTMFFRPKQLVELLLLMAKQEGEIPKEGQATELVLHLSLHGYDEVMQQAFS